MVTVEVPVSALRFRVLRICRAFRVSHRRAHAAAALSVLGWGSLYVAAKPAVLAVGPLHVAVVRATIASLALLMLAAGLGGWTSIGRELRRPLGIVVLGTLSFGVNQVFAMVAQRFLPASVNGLLNNLHPLWLAIGFATLGRSGRPLTLLAGSALAVLGIALVLNPAGAPGAIAPLGAVLAITGSATIACSSVVGRRVMRRRHAIATTGLAAGVGALALVPFAWLEQAPVRMAEAGPELWGRLVYLGLACTAMNFALWFYALKQLTATSASMYQYLIPPVGVALAVLLLGEPLTWGLLAGGAAVVVGIALGLRGARPR